MPSTSKVDVGDASIEFLSDGAGDPVVLIPGGGIDASYFGELARRIARAGFHEQGARGPIVAGRLHIFVWGRKPD